MLRFTSTTRVQKFITFERFSLIVFTTIIDGSIPRSLFPGSFWLKSIATIPVFRVLRPSFDRFPYQDIRAPSNQRLPHLPNVNCTKSGFSRLHDLKLPRLSTTNYSVPLWKADTRLPSSLVPKRANR